MMEEQFDEIGPEEQPATGSGKKKGKLEQSDKIGQIGEGSEITEEQPATGSGKKKGEL